jgi:tetratricopeptide (TPR) repeat protein
MNPDPVTPAPSLTSSSSSSEDGSLLLGGILTTLWIAIHVGAATRGGTLWGLHHLRYLDTSGVLLVAAFGGALVALASPVVRRGLARLPTTATDMGLAALTGCTAWILRDRSHLLGDGGVILTTASAAPEYHEREPFASLLGSAVTRLGEVTGVGLVNAFEGFSVLLGIVLVLLLVRADRATKAGGVLLLLAFVNGAMQLWFGYVEHYPPVALLVAAAMLAARAPVTRVAAVTPVLALTALAILMHVSSVLLLPAAAWIVGRQFLFRRTIRGRLLLLAEIAGVLAAAFLSWRLAWHGMDVPSLPGYLSILGQTGRFGYGGEAADGLGAPALFSLAHLLEYGNLLALIGAVSLPLAILGAVRVGPRILREDPWTVPLAVTSAAYLAAQFKFFPNLGAPRDWDVLAAGALPFAMLAARGVAGMRWKPERVLPWLAALAAIHTVPWIVVNASPAAARARFEEVPLPRGQAIFVFATRDLQEGRLEDARRGFQRVVEEQPRSIHAWHRLGITLDQMGDLEMATRAYERALDLYARDPRVPRSELEERIGYCLWRLGQRDEAYKLFQAALSDDPESLTARMFLAIIMDGAGKPEEVVRLLQRMLPRAAENPAVLVLTARALQQLDRGEEAEPLIQEAARLFPDDPGVRALMDSR